MEFQLGHDRARLGDLCGLSLLHKRVPKRSFAISTVPALLERPQAFSPLQQANSVPIPSSLSPIHFPDRTWGTGVLACAGSCPSWAA